MSASTRPVSNTGSTWWVRAKPPAPEPTATRRTEFCEQIVGVLTPQQRSAFVLREMQGLETAEVGEILGCSATTVRNHVFQARKALRKEMREHFPEYLPASERG